MRERSGDLQGGDTFPRLHHWLIAAAILFVMGHVVPLFAAFI